MKRICIIRHGYFPADIRVRKEALALLNEGNLVDIICLRQETEKKEEIYKGLHIYRIPVKRHREGISRYLYEYTSFFCLAAIKLSSLYFRNRYDFVQVNTLPDFLVFVTAVPKLFGAKIILDLHEPAPELFRVLFGDEKKLLINLVKFFEKISIRYADVAITVSEQMKKKLIERGSAQTKIEVVLNVPNLEFNLDRYKNDLTKSENKFLLTCHGAMLKRYGQDVAIKAIALIKEEVPNVQLNILGYGEYESFLKKMALELKLNNSVRFCGFIPFLDMVKMIAKSDIGIVPIEKNVYSELIHTNKMFEFIAMKTPVIISRTKAVQDFFGSDDSCLKYFESGDEEELARSIIELYHNPEKRKEMVNNAYTKFKSVHWEITKKNYCLIYEKLLLDKSPLNN